MKKSRIDNKKTSKKTNQSSDNLNIGVLEGQLTQKPTSAIMFQPPAPFEFKQPELWEKWYKRFERYRSASGLDHEPEEKQVSSLIYCMGSDAEEILTSVHLSFEDQNCYEKVKKAFDDIFIGKRNVIYERAKFNSRYQHQNELFDTFLADISSMAEHCAFKNLRDELIRDRIVVGIIDKNLSARLQEDSNLTLEKTIHKCKQKEAIDKQTVELEIFCQQKPAEVDRIKLDKSHTTLPNKKESYYKIDHELCWNCGGPRHSRNLCPAKDVICFHCKRIGHFGRCCRNRASETKPLRNIRKVNEIQGLDESNASEVTISYLGPVNVSCNNSNPWYVDIFINNQLVKAKIDSGAEVTAIPLNIIQTNLRKSDRILKNADQRELDVAGMFIADISYCGRQVKEKVYVVAGLNELLLGIPAIRSLDLIKLRRPNESVGLNSITIDSVLMNYPELFTGLGNIPGEYKIELIENAQPFSVRAPRNISIPLRPKVEAEINRMLNLGVIERVESPTDWCAPIVPVIKPDGSLRLCIDYTKLNRNVKRPKIILPDVEETLGQIGSSRIFSKLDAQSGFWQINISPDTVKLTTFITPFGRFYFKRLPFGITSAPEFFSSQMLKLLAGIDGVLCHMDDILIHGQTQEEHDCRLTEVLNRLKEAKVVINKNKCVISQTSVKFLGNLIDSDGIKVDPDRVRALEELPPPKDVTGVRRLNGMLNQLNKFIPNLADKTESFRELTRKNRQFCWTSQHQKAFSDIVKTVKESISLTKYNVNAEAIVIADSSAYGLGAMLLQVEEGVAKVVMFASRTLQDCERRYAQIEKEALGCAWAADKFSKFLVGKTFKILTDHKPLVPLLGSKDLDTIPNRIQRFKMRLMKFNYSIEHIPGKEMFTADTLSRAPIADSTDEFTNEVEAHIKVIALNFPATKHRLEQIKKSQGQCQECQLLVKYTENGWHEYKKDVPECMRKWYTFKSDISLIEDLICYKERIIIPLELRKDIMSKLHDGHFGLNRTILRAKQSVFWPGITNDLRNLIENCNTCIRNQKQISETMVHSDTPDYPWQKIAVDYFDFLKGKYLAVVDYYSRYLEMINVSTMSVNELIMKMKACFARYGIPEVVVSDSGSQFTSEEWRSFAGDFGFEIVTCSPLYHQANGEAERTVQTLKNMLMKNKDPVLALLEYRATPGPSGYSPSELLMGRRLRTRVPSLKKELKPRNIDHTQFREWDKQYRTQQAEYYNKRHRAKVERTLTPGSKVYIPDRKEEGKIVENLGLRSYTVATNGGLLRRNKAMLRPLSSAKQIGE